MQINGESIVQDGVAEIPLCTKANTAGLIYIDQYSNGGGLYKANTATGLIRIAKATDSVLTERANQYCPVVPANLDYAVKAAMCDGKGAAWTAEEQAAAQERMGIDEYEDVLDVTLEEDSLFSVDFEHEYKKLYIYIDQSGVEGDKCSTIYFNPYSYIGNDGRKINSFSVYEQTSINFCNIGSIWESSGKVTTRISFAGNPQKKSTGNMPAWIKFWDTSNHNKEGVGAPFKGIYESVTVFKAGTRIVIKGVRA